ncbi:MAG: M24 family metallopeptidase, partial [Anaerolineaceae bacterium]|nr:M24 family metallopeptidase [Anaerolineaceae bacterium]
MNKHFIEEKIHQAIGILNETDIDVWLTFVRETSCSSDPILPLIFGNTDLTWQSALIITRSGERIAIVGSLEIDTANSVGVFTTTMPYDESISPPLLETLSRINPRQIAVNTSTDDIKADGLTHGMYSLLVMYLSEIGFEDRLCSASDIISALVGRKTQTEIDRIKSAIQETDEIFAQTYDYIRVGMSEVDVADFMHNQLEQKGLMPAWEYDGCPIVNAGPESPVGHSLPSKHRKIKSGQILHIDFGVKKHDYCSDIQRMVYFLAPGEVLPPEP